MTSKRGFTLIELMVTIAVIAVLAAILIPNFIHARAQAQTSACEENLKDIATALEEYAVDHNGSYPASGDVEPNLFGGANNLYMGTTPIDPASGQGYHFDIPGVGVCTGDTYRLRDSNGHDTSTLTSLPSYNGTSTGIRYCPSSGIRAAQN
jgi:prepilin-type N-terminal cleavage/methylation domain-containing protein